MAPPSRINLMMQPPPRIVTGDETADPARELYAGLKQLLNVDCAIVSDTDALRDRKQLGGVAIALGNMANNALLRACYHRNWCLTDRTYPGPGGWEIRTVDAAWGGATPLILCGASDNAGTLFAVRRLLEIVKTSHARGEIDRVVDVKLGAGQEQLLAEIDAFAATKPAAEMRFGVSDADEIDKAGTYFYLTGRPSLGARYRDAWLKMAAAHPERVHEEQIHLRMCWRVQALDLLIDQPVFSDADRERIARYVAEVLDGPEAITNAGLVLRSKFREPRQNHETHVALQLIYGARFLRRVLKHPRADDWERAARRFFEVYDGGDHWKPVEDVCDFAFSITMVDVLDACLCFDDPPFVSKGGLKRAAELAMTGCGNTGYSPVVGDADGAWPRELLAAAGSLYRDGRYVWMSKLGRPTRVFTPRLQRAWADDVAPTPPNDLVGLRVERLDKLYYDVPVVDPEYAVAFYISKPNVDHARTFDKLTLRSGLTPDDQYVLMDGVAGGSHSYDDTGAIHAFDQFGRPWIVPEDNLHWPQQTQHNLVTIVRDGRSQRIPTFAEQRLEAGLKSTAFFRSAVKDYAGATWQRALVWRKGEYLLVLDEVEANEPGNYTIEARYRTLGDETFADDGTFTVTQGDASFHIASDGARQRWVEPVDISIAYLWDPQLVEDRQKRYGTWPVVLKMLHLSAEADLARGQRATVASLLWASKDALAKRWSVTKVGTLAAILRRGDDIEFVGQGSFQARGVEFTGEAFRIGAGVLALAGVTRLKLAGQDVIDASQPVDVELDRAAAIARVAFVTPPAKFSFALAATTNLATAGEHQLEHVRWDVLETLVRRLDVSAKSETPPATRPSLPALRSTRLETVAHPTCFGVLSRDQIAVGGADGDVALVDVKKGAAAWRAKIPGNVLTVAGGDLDSTHRGCVVVGGTGCAIHAFNAAGNELWTARPEFGSQFWVWWTLKESQIHRLLVDDIDNDGVPEVLAGVSNMRLHCYDADGRERWKHRTDWGIVRTFTAVDLNADGRKEIIGGTDLLSAVSSVRIVDFDGVERRKALWNQGWTAQLRSLLVADVDGDGKLEICCGTNREDCLRVHRADGSGLRWAHNLGDTVTGIGVARRGRNERRLVAGSRSFYVSAFDPASGDTRWVTNVRHAVTSLVCAGERTAAGTQDGRVIVLDFDGKVLSETSLGAPVTQLAMTDESDAIALGEGAGVHRLRIE
jgi:outer membrane protein assembly factor BamB